MGIAAHTATRLNTAVFDEAVAALRALTEYRDDLVRTRTQTVNRLHALLAQLVPAGLLRGLTADTAAAALLADAAAIPVAALTAWQALFEHGELTRGRRVLVNGAGGGVGGFVVQLAKGAPEEVIADARELLEAG